MYRRAHWWFLLAFLVVLGGFGPTFYARLGETSLPYLVHGGSATLWMVMLITQSVLISRGHRAWHRRIGWSSLVIFPVMLLSALYMIRLMVLRAEAYGSLTYVLAMIDIPTVFVLGVFYALAIAYCGRVELHSRYLAATVILLLPPALGRFLVFWVPGIEGLPAALNPTMVIVELVALVLILHDRRVGKVHPPYPITLVVLVLIHAMMWKAPDMTWWRWVAHLFG
jgi:hypothetical protein